MSSLSTNSNVLVFIFHLNPIRLSAVLFFCLAFGADRLPATEPFPGTKSQYHFFDKYSFKLGDSDCVIVAPKTVASGKPWIWRARFFGHEPQTEIRLLQHGFHVGYVDVAGLFGSPQAVAIWDAFYEHVTTQYGFSKTPALEGMSRGGLIIYNWAKANPDRVSCIYADAPVMDIKSWPGGKGRGKGSAAAWRQCLDAYGLSESEAMVATVNPIDGLGPLSDFDVPLLHVVGDADEVVPVGENTEILVQRFRELGGNVTVIHKPGVGHHPHSLKEPTPIVDFILKSTSH